MNRNGLTMWVAGKEPAMRRLKIIALLAVVCFGAASAQVDNLFVGGVIRTAIVYAPTGISRPPLLMSLHGATGDGALQRTRTQFNKIADREKFIVAYPNGNYANASHSWDDTGDDDIPFLLALIDTIDKSYGIDRSRVYCTGFSLGGMMTHRLACRASNRIAAIASVSGPDNSSDCPSLRPLPVMHIHGLADQTIDYSNAVETVKKWADRNGCPQVSQLIAPYPASNPNSKSKKEIWGPCSGNSEVVLISVDGLDHAWPKSATSDVDASEEIWAFLKNYSLASTAAMRSAVESRPQTSRVEYHCGKIVLHGRQGFYRICVFDMRGKNMGAAEVSLASGQASVCTVVLDRGPAAGIYLVKIAGSDGVGYVRITIAPH